MKHINIDIHSGVTCIDDDTKYFNPRSFCSRNKDYFLFFFKQEFYLISYNSCIDGGNKYDFYVELLKKLDCQKFNTESHFIEKSVHLDRIFKENRLRGLQYKTHETEICYKYSDRAGKEYAITNEISYSFFIDNSFTYHEKYKKADDYLEKLNDSNKEFLRGKLRSIYMDNYISAPSEIETVKTIDNLITKIKNHETSKQ